MKTYLFIASLSALATSAFALTALDDASNYGGGWADGSTGGSGFGTWSLNNNNDGSSVYAGSFIGDSTAGAGDINSGAAQSFGLYANPSAAYSTAIRSFSTALSVGDIFSFDFAVNYDDGDKGFNIRTAGDSIFNFNLGGGASVSSEHATIVPVTAVAYDYGGNDAMLEAVIEVISSNSINYQISRVSTDGIQGVLYSGSVTGIVNSIDNFEFYNANTTGGDQNNLYFNNLEVVPESSSTALIVGVLAIGCALRRRR